MKKITIIFTLIILLTGCANPVNNQNKNKDSNNITVQEVSNLMLEDWQQVIIIKDSNIIYRGEPDKIDQNLLNKLVLEIANTEDSYNNNSITLIIE
ncbi:lipoprotein [uncultured Thomasclavelia sp.]|uniref:lipoprotein n=1 Tax=uncultured Thomasclavelia sp. TaxID=3025759 RepID=UPI00263731D2|nr:lipoprotein [uncultured Thomasclavelia sp.]